MHVKGFHGRLAWARDPKGRERNLGELVSQFQYNYDVTWRTWVYSDRVDDDNGRCTALQDYKVQLADCDLLLPFICERGTPLLRVCSRHSVSLDSVVIIRALDCSRQVAGSTPGPRIAE